MDTMRSPTAPADGKAIPPGRPGFWAVPRPRRARCRNSPLSGTGPRHTFHRVYLDVRLFAPYGLMRITNNNHSRSNRRESFQPPPPGRHDALSFAARPRERPTASRPTRGRSLQYCVLTAQVPRGPIPDTDRVPERRRAHTLRPRGISTPDHPGIRQRPAVHCDLCQSGHRGALRALARPRSAAGPGAQRHDWRAAAGRRRLPADPPVAGLPARSARPTADELHRRPGGQPQATITAANAVAWATRPAGTSAVWHSRRLSVARCFARYLSAAMGYSQQDDSSEHAVYRVVSVILTARGSPPNRQAAM